MIIYLTPRPGYFKRVKIYRRCPEIRDLMRRAQWDWIKGAVITIPFVLLLIVPVLMITWGDWLGRQVSNKFRNPREKYFTRAHATADEMWEILPAAEIRKRIEA